MTFRPWDRTGCDPPGVSRQCDATKLRGRTISTHPPADGEVYVWDEPSQSWIPEACCGGSATIPATQIGQVMFSTNGTSFSSELPCTDLAGWLVEEINGILIVVDTP